MKDKITITLMGLGILALSITSIIHSSNIARIENSIYPTIQMIEINGKSYEKSTKGYYNYRIDFNNIHPLVNLTYEEFIDSGKTYSKVDYSKKYYVEGNK